MSSYCNNPEGFPVHALGDRLGRAVTQLTQATGSTASPNALAILAVISLSSQGLISVQKRDNLVSPVGLYFCSIQPSGERKSATLNRALASIHKFSAESSRKYAIELASYRAEFAIWSATGRGIERAIQKKSEQGECIADDLNRRLEHQKSEPKKPKRFKLIHENVTPGALLKSLANNIPTTALVSDEPLALINARGLNDPGSLNGLFDGKSMVIDRIEDGETLIQDPVMTSALFMQSGVFWKLMDQKGDALTYSGCVARYFFIAPQPMAGTRFIASSNTSSDEYMHWFDERCIALLNQHTLDESGNLSPRKIMRFTPEAQARWEYEHDTIEANMQQGGYLENFRDFGSKHADKIARLSALLHYFECNQDEIPLETLERAILIANWFAREFVRIFTPPPMQSQEQQDAFTLQSWLLNQYRVTSVPFIRKNELLQFGPKSV